METPGRHPRRIQTTIGSRTVGLALLIVALAASTGRGDVSTRVSGTTLIVTGDDSADTVSIESAPEGIAVVGLDGTLVDGSTLPVTVAGVRRLTVKLANGADRLTVTQVDLPNGLDIRLGKGNDDVVLDEVHVGATRIQTGNGSDAVGIFGPAHVNSLSVQTSNGYDSIVLHDTWIPGDLDIDAGADDDYVEIVDTEVGNDVHVDMGNGDDLLLLADIAFDDDTELDGEHGDDAVWLAGGIWFGDELDVDGFDDDDWWWGW